MAINSPTAKGRRARTQQDGIWACGPTSMPLKVQEGQLSTDASRIAGGHETITTRQISRPRTKNKRTSARNASTRNLYSCHLTAIMGLREPTDFFPAARIECNGKNDGRGISGVGRLFPTRSDKSAKYLGVHFLPFATYFPSQL